LPPEYNACFFNSLSSNIEMCGRYVSPDQAAIERQWHIGRSNSNPFAVRYNVAPQQGIAANYVPVIRLAEDSVLELAALQWWLLPFWSKEPRVKHATFNARVETVAKLASFRESFKRRRCVVPAIGWYEWQELASGKRPWFLHAANGELLSFAGLWDHWERDGQVIDSCCIVVGPANDSVRPIHARMPVVLPRERCDPWLDRGVTDLDKVMELLQPASNDALAFHQVSARVSNARNQGPELIAPLRAEKD
jgi:putative SOS response-associated peptidase YedK